MFLQLKPNAQLNYTRRIDLPIGVMPHQYNLYADHSYDDYNLRLSIHDCKDIVDTVYCYYCGNEADYIRRGFLHDGSGYNLWVHAERSSNYALCQICDKHLKGIKYLGRSQELIKNIKNILKLKPFILLPTIESYHSHFDFSIDGLLYPKNNISDNTINLLSLNSDILVERRNETLSRVFNDLLSFIYDLLDFINHDAKTVRPPIKFKYPLDLNFALANYDALFIDVIEATEESALTIISDKIINNELPIEIIDLKREDSKNNFININYSNIKNGDVIDYSPRSFILNDFSRLHSLLYQRLNENINLNLNKNYNYRKRSQPVSLSNSIFNHNHKPAQYFHLKDRENETINSRIKKFTFENIRKFKSSSSLEFGSSKSIILIGENGVGKSSFLDLMNKCLGNKNSSLSSLISLGKQSTQIAIDFDNGLPPTIITQNGRRAIAKNKHTRFNVINIGEQRLNKTEIKKQLDFIIENKNEDELINLIGYHLKFLFDLTVNSEFKVINNTVVIFENGKDQPIENYSSGYLSILSIYMSVLMRIIKLGGIKNYKINIANSIILIDEIELHLHPKFKKEIMRKLNVTFSETLIFATTHDPLILSSCTENDKIVTFRNNGDYTVIDDQLPNVHNYSIEQILTSPIFGLSTVNRHEENLDKIERYHSALKKKDWELVDSLQDELADSGYFGNSYREFLAHSIVDIYSSESITVTKQELVKELKQSENGE